MDPKKIDDHTIEISKTETVSNVVAYDYDFLKSQRIAIGEQKARDNALRDAELAEIDALLAEADSLGVVSRDKESTEGDEAEAKQAE